MRFFVFVITEHDPVSIELDGSPYRIVNQPQGVLYALNLGGPMHEALNKVVFAGTETTFKVDDKADGKKNTPLRLLWVRVRGLSMALFETTASAPDSA